jgi:hypothetical protein
MGVEEGRGVLAAAREEEGEHDGDGRAAVHRGRFQNDGPGGSEKPPAART